MRKIIIAMVAVLILPILAYTQIPPTPHPNQQELLESDDPGLAANKKLVYDMWRIVLEARHVDQAEEYMREDYIQHNPSVPTGRAAFVEFFSQMEPQPIQPTIQRPLISMVAEGDMVVLSFVHEVEDPDNPGETYKTTWFDMFRIENGKIAEHWDSALR